MKYKVTCSAVIEAQFEVEADNEEELYEILDEETGTEELPCGNVKVYCEDDCARLKGVSVSFLNVEDIESEVK